MNTTLVGKAGEASAAEYLRKEKYRLLAANYRCRFGEIDLIAEKKDFVVFVEVKTRKNNRFSAACEAVTLAKQNKLRLTASQWMMEQNCKKQGRFDVIEVYTDNQTINHIENAFI